MWIVSFKIIISMKRGILRFVSMLFLIYEKGMSKKKTVLGILRFVSMFFLIFEKGDEQRNCARYFKICKYSLFNIWKGDEQKKTKKLPGILRFVIMLFLIFEKGDV